MPQIEVAFDIDANGIVHVTAKDLGTGKEQKIEIQSGSGLSDEEIEQMVTDAESHADEDRKARELAEARNVGENAAYQAEKQIGEMGDQLDDSDKAEINEAVSELKAVLDSSDVDQIKAKTEAVQAAFHKASEKIYQQAAADQAAAGADGAASGNGASADDEEEVVDAEVVDEDRS